MVRLRELEGELEQVDLPFLILHGAEVQYISMNMMETLLQREEKMILHLDRIH
jgi:hypothetical protein